MSINATIGILGLLTFKVKTQPKKILPTRENQNFPLCASTEGKLKLSGLVHWKQ